MIETHISVDINGRTAETLASAIEDAAARLEDDGSTRAELGRLLDLLDAVETLRTRKGRGRSVVIRRRPRRSCSPDASGPAPVPVGSLPGPEDLPPAAGG